MDDHLREHEKKEEEEEALAPHSLFGNALVRGQGGQPGSLTAAKAVKETRAYRRSEGPERTICSMCEQIFSTGKELRHHMNETHLQGPPPYQ